MSADMTTGKCRACAETKALTNDNFQFLKTTGYFRTICKVCTNARQREFYAGHTERYKAYQIKDYAKHRAKRQAVARASANSAMAPVAVPAGCLPTSGRIRPPAAIKPTPEPRCSNHERTTDDVDTTTPDRADGAGAGWDGAGHGASYGRL